MGFLLFFSSTVLSFGGICFWNLLENVFLSVLDVLFRQRRRCKLMDRYGRKKTDRIDRRKVRRFRRFLFRFFLSLSLSLFPSYFSSIFVFLQFLYWNSLRRLSSSGSGFSAAPPPLANRRCPAGQSPTAFFV